MDLEYLGAPDLARRYLDWYAEFAADPAPASLRHHFIAYRAFVRSKVACVRTAQGDEAARAPAEAHAELALAHLRTGAVRLVLVGGLPGSGKSTLSGTLADALGAVVLATDRVRKEIAHRWPDEPASSAFGAGLYSPEWTDRTYAEVLRRAGELLRLGESVVLDASWTESRHRELARALAHDAHASLAELRCEAPAEVAGARLRTRPRTVSDADARIAAAMAERADPWPQALGIDTTRPEPDSATQALDAVLCGATTRGYPTVH
jgi:predicted kinase